MGGKKKMFLFFQDYIHSCCHFGSVMSFAAGRMCSHSAEFRPSWWMHNQRQSSPVNHNVSPAEGKRSERKHCEQRTSALCDQPSVFFIPSP